jgi:hypothetical protein
MKIVPGILKLVHNIIWLTGTLKTKKDDRSLKITQNSIKELAVPSEHTQGLLLCRGTRHGIYIGEGHQCWEIFIQFVTLDLIHGIEIDSTTLNGRHSINV